MLFVFTLRSSTCFLLQFEWEDEDSCSNREEAAAEEEEEEDVEDEDSDDDDRGCVKDFVGAFACCVFFEPTLSASPCCDDLCECVDRKGGVKRARRRCRVRMLESICRPEFHNISSAPEKILMPWIRA